MQFAAGTDGRDYAIKFYIEQDAFRQEQDIYSEAALQSILPPVAAMFGNEDGSMRDSHGVAVPPFVVVEKGAPLSRRCQHCARDAPGCTGSVYWCFVIICFCSRLRACAARLHLPTPACCTTENRQGGNP